MTPEQAARIRKILPTLDETQKKQLLGELQSVEPGQGSLPSTPVTTTTATTSNTGGETFLSGLIRGLGSAVKSEVGMAKDIGSTVSELGRTIEGRDPARIALASLGAGIKTGYNVAGTQLGIAAKSSGGLIKGVLNYISPEMVSNIEKGSKYVDEKTKDAISKLANSSVGKKIIKEYDNLPSEADVPTDWGKARPITKEFVNSFINIAGGLPLTKVGKLSGTLRKTEEDITLRQLESQVGKKTEQLPIVGTKLEKGAISSVKNMLKGNKSDFENGFDVEYLLEKNLLDKKMLEENKGESTIRSLRNNLDQQFKIKREELANAIKESPIDIDINSVYKKTVNDIAKNPISGYGNKDTIDKTLEKIASSNEELLNSLSGTNIDDMLSSLPPDRAKLIMEQLDSGKATINDFVNAGVLKLPQKNTISLPQAQELKKTVGKLGAWVHDEKGVYIPDDVKASAKVWDIFYSNLKKEIEDAAADGNIKEINRELQKLIAADRVVERRIPVAERANPIGLNPIITMASPSLIHSSVAGTASVINSLVRSGSIAQSMYNTGTGKTMLLDKLKNNATNTITNPLGAYYFTKGYNNQ